MLKTRKHVILVQVFIFSLLTASCGGGSGNGSGSGGGGNPSSSSCNGTPQQISTLTRTCNIAQRIDGSAGILKIDLIDNGGDIGDSISYYVVNNIEDSDSYPNEFLRQIPANLNNQELINIESDSRFAGRAVFRYNFEGHKLDLISDKDNNPLEPITGDMAIVTNISNSHKVVHAGGDLVSNLPDGEYEYNGTTLIAARLEGQEHKFGEFEMTVDFRGSRGNIVATTTGDFRSSLSGNFSINETDGTFSGTNLELTVDDNVNFSNRVQFSNEAATTYGSFHHDRATGVTGIYFTNDDADYIGAFVGVRSDQR